VFALLGALYPHDFWATVQAIEPIPCSELLAQVGSAIVA